jgi:hypothetical protein
VLSDRTGVAIAVAILAAVVAPVPSHGQAPAAQMVAPDIPGVVLGGTRVELVQDGLAGADDPIAVPGVGLVFSEPDASRILVLDDKNHISTLVEQSNDVGLERPSRLRAIAQGTDEDRDGQHLGIIPMSRGGLDCQGLAFGGADKRTLYVAGHGSLFKITMLATGFKGRAK